MNIDKALETLFAMANVQDGYAKKATDPGLKVIHKANAKAQREVAATIKDLRARLASTTAERDAALARVEKLREALGAISAYSDADHRVFRRQFPRLYNLIVEARGTECPSREIVLSDFARAALDEDARHG